MREEVIHEIKERIDYKDAIIEYSIIFIFMFGLISILTLYPTAWFGVILPYSIFDMMKGNFTLALVISLIVIILQNEKIDRKKYVVHKIGGKTDVKRRKI